MLGIVPLTRSLSLFCVGIILGLSLCGPVEADSRNPIGTKQLDSDERLACGGTLEQRTWSQWESSIRPYASNQLIERRLVAEGDTYALYDFELGLHNLLAMAQRCGRVDRQLEFAQIVEKAYSKLEPYPGSIGSGAWICKGGRICNGSTRLINAEVELNSSQFLAFATSLANGLIRSANSEYARRFADETAKIALNHLERWDNSGSRDSIRKRRNAKVSDVQDGSSSLFLQDQDLWIISIYADVAGILKREEEIGKTPEADLRGLLARREYLNSLLGLFSTRVSTQRIGDGARSVLISDLDAGFWRYYADNRYAGYQGDEQPVRCGSASDGQAKASFLGQKAKILVAKPSAVIDVGWDLSHARRLVHFFDALSRNRDSLSAIFGAGSVPLPSEEIQRNFARQIRTRVWNQDEKYPLFTNYLSGANGWYRVNYDNGTGRCFEGYPPYGLSDAFPTGGYAQWMSYDPKLKRIAVRILDLLQSNRKEDQEFVGERYASFVRGEGVKGLNEVMFWPSLIGNRP